METTRYELKETAVGYKGQVLIHGINLTVHAGEIVTLIGPNGAGKSTILKTMIRQLDALDGSIFLNGKALSQTGYQDLSKEVSVLLTGRISPELMTSRDVVEAGRYPYTGRMGLLREEDRRIAMDAMKLAGVETIADRLFSELSDGQRQRVLFARALCQKPKVLILDEPTSYLDIRYKLELLDVLKRLVKEEQLAVIMSLHEIDLAQKISDQIVCVKGDTIVRIGTPEEIFEGPLISELYELKEGRYDPLMGSVELPSAPGKPEVFVISSGGSGILVYRKLVRDGIPFAAGILYDNDIDCHAAREMQAHVIAAEACSELDEETVQKAIQMVHEVKTVILTEVKIGQINRRLRDVIREAERLGRLVRWQNR